MGSWPPSRLTRIGRILTAYGGVFVVGSLAWGMAVDGFRPDRYDLAGAVLCLAGVAVIMYAPPDQLAPANPHRTGSRHGD